STVINQELVPSGHFSEVVEMRTNDSRILRLPRCRPTVLHVARLEIEKNKQTGGVVTERAAPVPPVGYRRRECPETAAQKGILNFALIIAIFTLNCSGFFSRSSKRVVQRPKLANKFSFSSLLLAEEGVPTHSSSGLLRCLSRSPSERLCSKQV
ncbi:unnamed protein product, partial [Heterotrigona itama]